MESTVTLSLEKFDSMREELKSLKYLQHKYKEAKLTRNKINYNPIETGIFTSKIVEELERLSEGGVLVIIKNTKRRS